MQKVELHICVGWTGLEFNMYVFTYDGIECTYFEDVNLEGKKIHFYFSVVPGIFGNQQAHHLDSIKQMLHQCLVGQSNVSVSSEFFYH